MTPAWWMAGASVLSWGVIAWRVGFPTAFEALFGMGGPLLMTTGSWLLVERTYRHDPRSLTAVMIAAFAAKMVFFGAYVIVMLRVLSLRPVPFMASFTGYFVGLYLAEAFCLWRLFSDGTRVSR